MAVTKDGRCWMVPVVEGEVRREREWGREREPVEDSATVRP